MKPVWSGRYVEIVPGVVFGRRGYVLRYKDDKRVIEFLTNLNRLIQIGKKEDQVIAKYRRVFRNFKL